MRRTIASALEIAGRHGHDEAQPEHFLLAINGDSESAAAFMFEHAGVSRADVAQQTEKFSPRGAEARQRASRLSSAALMLLDAAAAEADKFGHEHIGTEHLALALIKSRGHVASDILSRLGMTAMSADAALRAWIEQDSPRKRSGLDRLVVRRPWLRRVIRPLQAIARPPALAWRVYVKRSLAHPRFVSDPYAMYRWLREREPVRQDPLAPVWIVTRYDDASTVLRDPRFKKDPFAAERLPRATREQLKIPAGAARSEIETVSMLFLDPPEHTRVRSMFTRAFSPKVVESMRPRIEQITKERLDRAKGSGMIDVIGDLAYPLPVMIIAELLGFPASDHERIKQWSDDMAGALSLNPSPKAQQKAGLAREELREYFNVLVPDLKRRGHDNLLSVLLDLEREPGALNREEIFSNAVVLLAAGHETTTNLIGNGVLALLDHPDQLALLRENPKLIDQAMDEFLRYDTPVQWTSRVAGETIELGGKTIERGQIVMACLGAANRDPSQFENPEVLDLRRANAKTHLALGQGPHYCLGAVLGKMEASIAIGELVRRFPNLRLAKRNLPRITGLTFRGVKQLPLYLD